jgi:hypothetical protein
MNRYTQIEVGRLCPSFSIASIFSLFVFTLLFAFPSFSQGNLYDEQSVRAVQAQLRSRGIRIEAGDNCHADVFQLSKRILEGVTLDQLRLNSTERILAVDRIPDLQVILMSRDWMRESMGVSIQSEILMKDIPVMLSIDSDNQIEFSPNKLEISKQ